MTHAPDHLDYGSQHGVLPHPDPVAAVYGHVADHLAGASEAILQTRVLRECKRLRLKTLVIPDSTRVSPGWVDVLVFGRGCIAIELKSEDGRRSQAQIEWAQAITRAGIPYRLWRPEDWDNGTIKRELEALR